MVNRRYSPGIGRTAAFYTAMKEVTALRIKVLGAQGFSLSDSLVHVEVARDDGEHVI